MGQVFGVCERFCRDVGWVDEGLGGGEIAVREVFVEIGGVVVVAAVAACDGGVFCLLTVGAADEALEEEGGKDDDPAAAFADEHLEGLEDGLLEGLGVGGVAVGYALHVLGMLSMAVMYVMSWRTRTWYLVSNVLQTPVSSIIATRNGMKPLVDMMAIVLGDVAGLNAVL
jgi:hypothetical protein